MPAKWKRCVGPGRCPGAGRKANKPQRASCISPLLAGPGPLVERQPAVWVVHFDPAARQQLAEIDDEVLPAGAPFDTLVPVKNSTTETLVVRLNDRPTALAGSF